MTHDILLVGLGYVGGVLLMAWFGEQQRQAECLDCHNALREVTRWKGIAESRQHSLGVWMTRADKAEQALKRQIELGAYRVPLEKAPSVLREIFRPKGAPSTEQDVDGLRAWRERRAVTGRDHTTQHFAEGVIPSEWAREVLAFTVGGNETMEGEP